MKKYAFVVHYVDVDEVLWIVAVYHGHRRPGYWQERLADIAGRIEFVQRPSSS